MTVSTVLSRGDPFFAGHPFHWDGRLFTTIPDFQNYLADPVVRATLDKWAEGVTVHHTWLPTVQGWLAAGSYNSLKGVIKEWRDVRGWPTGPNMIIAPEGIYLASGVDGPGIHAGVCNGTHVGIEIVGNYDKGYWVAPIRDFVFGAVTALCFALRISPADVISKKLVNGHRECLPNKSCPGNGIDLDRFRKDIAASMTASTLQTDATVIGVQPSITLAQFQKYLADNHAPVPATELERVYAMAKWLEIDPAFVSACWKQEAFVDDPNDGLQNVAVIGGSPLQKQSHCPMNIGEAADTLRRNVYYNGRKWRAWSTWQLGLMDTLLYFKDSYGAKGLLTVRQIIPVLAPPTDGNDPDTYISNVLLRMEAQAKL